MKVSYNFIIPLLIDRTHLPPPEQETISNIPPKHQFTWPKIPNILDPPLPKLAQSLATKLCAQKAMKFETIPIEPPKITTKQGLPAVIFKPKDYKIKLAHRCKYTLIGKFANIMPRMEVIRK